MKKLVLSIIIAAGGLISQSAQAQVGVNVGLRIGPLVINVHKPIAPAVVYDDFYYLPEVDAYYSVPEHCYYYNDGYNWVNAAYLPGAYRNYDWRTARRYEVRAQRPYANHDYYRNKYNGSRNNNWNNRGGNDQYAYRGPQRNDDRNGNWNNRGGNDRYDNRAPQRGNDRGNGGRQFPDSPYDSNNGGRGGYNQQGQPNRGNRPDDDRNQQQGNDRGNWNGQGQNGGDRNQGGRGNDNNNQQPGRANGGQGNYGQPSNGSNQGGGRNGNYGQPANDGGNRGNGRGQNNQGGAPTRQHFAGNMPQDLGRNGIR